MWAQVIRVSGELALPLTVIPPQRVTPSLEVNLMGDVSVPSARSCPLIVRFWPPLNETITPGSTVRTRPEGTVRLEVTTYSMPELHVVFAVKVPPTFTRADCRVPPARSEYSELPELFIPDTR